MTVSAHLTPEPERRLWLILEGMRRAAAERELKLGALAVLAVMELALLPGAGLVARLALGLTLPLAVLGLAPVARLPGWLGFLEASPRKASVDDCMIAPEDVSKYVLGELILKMDRYLGGGITATPYFEDIVAQILVGARLAERKRRLLAAVCVLIGAGHLALLVPPLAAAEPPKSALVQELETDLGSQWDALHDERRPSRPARKAAASSTAGSTR